MNGLVVIEIRKTKRITLHDVTMHVPHPVTHPAGSVGAELISWVGCLDHA